MRTMTEWIRGARAVAASDLHVAVGVPPAIRVHGKILVARNVEPVGAKLMHEIVDELLNEDQKRHLARKKQVSFSLWDPEAGRIRVTVYYHAGMPGLSLRLCPLYVPNCETLGLPAVVDGLARKRNGLVLVTGPTGVGKTTTLNYMVDLINRERYCKIVTIEDPVEYVHQPMKSIIVHQEVTVDTPSFSDALINVLRQDPDVIVIGELRDPEAIATAVTAAETGHLVLATLHSPNATQAVERITGVFDPARQSMIQLELANCLEGVISQDLVPRLDGKGRVLACEVLLANEAIRNIIRENKLQFLFNVLQTGHKAGMITMDASLRSLHEKGLITHDALASHRRDVQSVVQGVERADRTVSLAPRHSLPQELSAGSALSPAVPR